MTQNDGSGNEVNMIVGTNPGIIVYIVVIVPDRDKVKPEKAHALRKGKVTARQIYLLC